MGTHPIFESDFDCLTDSLQMPSSRSRRPSTISDDEFGEQTLAVIKRCKKATVDKIYEQLEIMDMSKDEVFVRLDSMCEAGLLDKIEQKNGEVFFKNPPKEAKKKKETKEVKEEPPEDIEDTTQDSVESSCKQE